VKKGENERIRQHKSDEWGMRKQVGLDIAEIFKYLGPRPIKYLIYSHFQQIEIKKSVSPNQSFKACCHVEVDYISREGS